MNLRLHRTLFCTLIASLSSANLFAQLDSGDLIQEASVTINESSQSAEVIRVDPLAGRPVAANNLYINQWIHPDVDGSVKGNVVTLVGQDTLSLSGTTISLVQAGQVMASARSDVNGQFVLPKIVPGYYSLIADAENSFAAFGIAVVSNENGKHLPTDLAVRVIRPRGIRLQEILRSGSTPTSFSDTRADIALIDPLADQRAYPKSHRIMIGKDGSVSGRLSKMGRPIGSVDMSGMTAYLLKEGAEVAKAMVKPDGEFVFENMSTGTYGLVATGGQGVAATAFCVVKSTPKSAMKNSNQQVLVAAMQGSSDSLNVELADNSDVMQVQEPVTPPAEEVIAQEDVPPPPAAPMPIVGGAMPGGGVYGGGGSGGGLGQFGGLIQGALGLGAIALLADAIDNNDNNNNNNAPVSPIVVNQ